MSQQIQSVQAVGVVIGVLAGSRAFCASLPGNFELLRSQLFLPFGFRLFDFFDIHNACSNSGCVELDNPNGFIRDGRRGEGLENKRRWDTRAQEL